MATIMAQPALQQWGHHPVDRRHPDPDRRGQCAVEMEVPVIRPLLLSLGFVLLASLPGCGPGDGSEARGTGQEASHLAPVASSGSTELAEVPAPLGPRLVPAGSGEARPADKLVVPDWMANDLASPDVPVRLTALDRWAQQGPNAPLDPLVVALDDEDEQVRAKAMELFEQAWAAERGKGR